MYTATRDIFKNTEKFLDTEVTLGGWVRTLRDNKNFGFIELNDGTFFKNIQVVFVSELENFQEISKVGVGASLTVTGVLVESIGAKQPFELKASKIVIEGESPSDYPLQKKRHTLEYMRTIAHLRPKANIFMAAFRVRSVAAYAIHKFFNERGYVYVHTPIITGSDCEGAGEMFKVSTLDFDNVKKAPDGKTDYSEDFFGKMAGLTVSGQLSVETFMMAFRDTYTFGPTFRAENSNTTRHAAEFWMIEPEIAFATLKDNMRVAEDMLKFVIAYVLENAKEEMQFFNEFIDKGLIERLEAVLKSDFGVITYTEAIEVLEKAPVKFEYKVAWGVDIQTEHERYITETVFGKPVFVINYPKEIKSFYMRQNDDGKTVGAMDLLVPSIGELIGGSEREERMPNILNRMEELGLDKNDYWWYLDLRKYGTVKHAGFGLGFERLIMYLTGISNIRDVVPFPRTVNSAEF